jgi:ABC-2 type transport system ATP-binding protein
MIAPVAGAAPQRTIEARPDAPPEPVVRVMGLTKQFAVRRSWGQILRSPWRKPERTTALNNVHFEVLPSEFFGLLGANGAGKTTLFKVLATQLLPDAGTASIAGYDVVRQAREVRRLLTPVVADERSLNWRLSARENLQLFAALYGLRAHAARERVRELLETVELTDAGTKLVGAFSSGMKQRLLIARALIPRPRVLLLDEPTRSLDPISARRFRKFLKEELVARQQCTVLLATHNAEEAFELCDSIAVLDRGVLLATGPVQQLMRQVSDDRYRLSVRESQAGLLARAFTTVATDFRQLEDSDDSRGWTNFEVRIPGGPDGAAEQLASLMLAGISVSQFERIDVSLADLIERIVLREVRPADA